MVKQFSREEMEALNAQLMERRKAEGIQFEEVDPDTVILPPADGWTDEKKLAANAELLSRQRPVVSRHMAIGDVMEGYVERMEKMLDWAERISGEDHDQKHGWMVMLGDKFLLNNHATNRGRLLYTFRGDVISGEKFTKRVALRLMYEHREMKVYEDANITIAHINDLAEVILNRAPARRQTAEKFKENCTRQEK